MDICDHYPDIYSTILSMIKSNRIHNTLIFESVNFPVLGVKIGTILKGLGDIIEE